MPRVEIHPEMLESLANIVRTTLVDEPTLQAAMEEYAHARVGIPRTTVIGNTENPKYKVPCLMGTDVQTLGYFHLPEDDHRYDAFFEATSEFMARVLSVAWSGLAKAFDDNDADRTLAYTDTTRTLVLNEVQARVTEAMRASKTMGTNDIMMVQNEIDALNYEGGDPNYA